MRPHFVYVVAAKGKRVVKIGRSADPHARLAALRTGQHETLELARAFRFDDEASAGHIERTVHRSLAAHRLNGEWFAVSASLAGKAIKEAAATARDVLPTLVALQAKRRCKCNPWDDGVPSLDCPEHKNDPGASRLRRCGRCWVGHPPYPRCRKHGDATETLAGGNKPDLPLGTFPR